MSDRQAQFLEENVTKFVNRTQRRNTREIRVSYIIIAVFAFDITYGISQNRDDNFLLVGSATIIFALLLNITIIKWKLYIPKSEISAFPPSRFPDKWKHHLTNQARMLRLAYLWYLLPLFLGIFIYLLSLYDQSFISLIIVLVFEVAIFIGAWRLNLKTAKQLERDRDAWFGRNYQRQSL